LHKLIEEIKSLFKEIDELLQETPETEKLEIYVIGGIVLLKQGLKPATKDIDLVVLNVNDFMLFESTLKTRFQKYETNFRIRPF
jgi:hypothetical protein